MSRYDQCDDTCTTDCGHCKGKGRPRAAGSGRGDDGARCEYGHTKAQHRATGACEAPRPTPAADCQSCVICGYGRREHEGDGEMVHDFAARTAEEPVAIYARIMRVIAGDDPVLLARLDELDARLAAERTARPAAQRTASAVEWGGVKAGKVDGLREVVATWMRRHLFWGLDPARAPDAADALLALPEIIALREAAEKVRRVEEVVRYWDIAETPAPVMEAEIRAALGGEA